MKKRKCGSGSHSFPLRKLALWGAGILTGIVLLLLLGYAQLLSYLQGESFRDSLENILANKAHAESVEIDGTLHIDGHRVTLPAVSARKPGVLHGVDARGIHADMRRSALLDRELHLTRLSIEEGTLILNTELGSSEPATATQPAVKKMQQGFLSGFTPRHARLDRANCNRFNSVVRFGGRDFSLTSSALEARPLPTLGKSAWEFRLSNGRLHTPLPILGDCSLKTATLTWGGKVSSVSDARLMLSPGELILNAAQEHNSKKWSADLRVNKMDIARLLREDWKKRLTGELFGQLDMRGSERSLSEAKGRISLQDGVLEALPFLSNLPLGNSYPYRSLCLERAEAHLSYPYADASRNIRRAWLMDNIDVQAKDGMLCMKGHVMVDEDGTLAGTLHIGLPTSIATQIAPVDSPLHGNLFSDGEEGNSMYLWLRLNLSGTLSDPQEDLSVRLMTLVGGKLVEKAGGLLGNLLSGGKSSQPTPEDDTTSAEDDEEDESDEEDNSPSPADSIDNAGNAAKDIINTGLRGLF